MDESPRGRIPGPPPCYCSRPWRFQAEVGEEMAVRGGGGEGSPKHLSVEAAHGSQLPRSVLSRDRLLVFRGDTGLGGLLRLELLEAVECRGESESWEARGRRQGAAEGQEGLGPHGPSPATLANDWT